MTGPDALIQDFYASEYSNAVCSISLQAALTHLIVQICADSSLLLQQVHLTVDTAMESGEIAIAAYVARKVSLGDRLLARKFQQVEVEVKTAAVESIGGESLQVSPCNIFCTLLLV